MQAPPDSLSAFTQPAMIRAAEVWAAPRQPQRIDGQKRGSPTCQRLALPSLATGLVGFAVCNPKRPSRRRQRRLSRCVLRATKAEASKLVICFDFDGVVCDSVDESSTAAWKHARDLWPLVSTLGDSPQPFLDPMRLVRPVIETGWENTLIIRMLADANLVEAQSQKGEAESASLLCKDILAGWEQLRDEKVRELKLDVQGLIKGFGEVRDKWMAEDLKSWFGTNRAYDRVPDVIIQMLSSGAEVFVITTKQKRFAEALLQDFGIKLPAGHVFALEDGPKTEVLKSLLARAEYREKNFHFIEDKLGTLRKVLKDPDLKTVKLHLASWGYCTKNDIDEVTDGLDVNLLHRSDLESLGVSEPWL
ncbi:unnamed protein product [Durusdinium trenchii]|uniref:Uncharacterized protein n=1 Tax=Durusdinium trenchii TaxID=1381693 RepID=A0ABP0SB58_9DINO